MPNNLPALVTFAVVLLCAAVLYGCYRAFDRLQTHAEQTYGRQRWLAIGLAGGVGVIALCTFWACFVFSAGFLQAVGLNLR